MKAGHLRKQIDHPIMSRGTTALINIRNLKHNFKVLSELAPAKLVVVVKADAYGHGLKQVVKALDKVDCFGVATIDEAILVRRTRPRARILLLEGFLDVQELKIAFDHNFDSVIHQFEQLDMLDSVETSCRMNVWLKYDSGMNRLGFNDDEYVQALARLDKHHKLQDLILMSHLASADIKHNDFTVKQTHRFLKYRSGHQVSLSNSAALLNKDHMDDEWCRVGLALFGVSPILNSTAENYNLKPVMTLKTNVIATKIVKGGQGIGYSQDYIVKKNTKIAIIGIGYGDGFPWSLTKGVYVKVNEKKAEIVGRVSMDMIAIDVSLVNNIKIGDSVLIWGEAKNTQLPIEILASYANTIPYVLLCQITSRVHYKYE